MELLDQRLFVGHIVDQRRRLGDRVKLRESSMGSRVLLRGEDVLLDRAGEDPLEDTVRHGEMSVCLHVIDG